MSQKTNLINHAKDQLNLRSKIKDFNIDFNKKKSFLKDCNLQSVFKSSLLIKRD